MRRPSFTNRKLLVLTLLAGAGGACSQEPSETTGQNQEQDEYIQQIQAELDAAAVSNPNSINAFKPVKPVLKCVAKTGTNQYTAHFGYTNSSSSSVSIPVGFFNRFWPPPISKGQPTTFAPGTQADVVSVPFSGFSASIWILGNHFAVATKFSKVCPAGGTGGTGTGGRGTGGTGAGGVIVGTGGMGTGGNGTGGVCGAAPSTCDDQNPCTIDAVGSDPTTGCAICIHIAALDGGACSDGNACTVGDTCQAGACVGGAPKTCTALDQCHIGGACDPATGVCSNPAAPDGRTCNDGNACTVNDICVSGICTMGAPILCNAPDPCHRAGVCDVRTGACSNPSSPDGTPCDNYDRCNQNPICMGGVCSGAPTVCTAIDQCHIPGVCDPANGTCSNPVAPNGVTCNDNNACTLGDFCSDGSCAPGTAKTCVASGVCHGVGSCDPASGACSDPVLPEGASCSDGNACTPDSCRGGICFSGLPVVCPPATGQCQVAGVCNPATGLCNAANLPDGTPCDDGEICTLGEVCRAGVCTPPEVPMGCELINCDQCSFGVEPGAPDFCSSSPDGCFNCIPESDGCQVYAPTSPDRALCEDLYKCLVAPTHPGTSIPSFCTSQGDPSRCWCGTNLTTCTTDNTPPTQANGPCLQQVFAAGKSTDAATINVRFIDPNFPLGRAVNLAACHSNFCSSECGVHP